MSSRCCLLLAPWLSAAAALCGQTPVPAPATGNQPVANAAAPATAAKYPSGSDVTFGTQVLHLLADPAVAQAHWGLAVTTMDGTPVYGLDEGKLFRPASTAKIFTTAAAMALLGPDARFTTEVYGQLNPATGAVKGDLVLVGGGDPSFGTNDLAAPGTATTANRDLQELADQLAAKGVRSVSGNVVADDQLFATEPPPEGWAAEDLAWGYGALPNALTYRDNEMRLTIQPHAGKGGADPDRPPAAVLQLDQPVPYLRLANNVTTEPHDPGQRDRVDVQPVPGHPQTLTVLGSISPNTPPITEKIAVPDPALYAAQAFRAALAEHGIRVTGQAATTHSTPGVAPSFLSALRAPEDCETSTVHGGLCSVDCLLSQRPRQLLAQHTSGVLADEVKFTLKTSANLHAEILQRQLSAKVTCAGATTLGGARMLRAWLLQAGISDREVVLYDGSGLSAKDLVTPRAEAQLLAYAATQPWFAAWRAALPVGGVDGTLASRFSGPALKGKVMAKTGTLGESRGLAGYLQCASGRELIFSILVDDHDPGSSADRTIMDALVDLIAASN